MLFSIGITGKVVERNDPLEGVADLSVFLYDSPRKVLDSTKTDKEGRFRFFSLPSKEEHLVKFEETDIDLYVEILKVNDKGRAIMSSGSNEVDSDGFFHFRELPYMKTGLSLEPETDFTDLKIGNNIVLQNVYFEYGEYTLLEKSYKELDKLIKILGENPALSIEISGHTDNIGSKEFNLILSEKRARSVVDYLLSKGIGEERLTYKGYGNAMPLTKNDEEEERQKNRRVEFKIIGGD